MSQERGLMGRLVGSMIRRSVRARFHTVYWTPVVVPEPPIVFYANHHGWMDGYLMYHLVTRLGVRCLDWIEEFDAFPLFGRVGGIRFAKDDPMGRAMAVRQTIRQMNAGASLVLFPEGKLHRPPDLLPFGRGLELIAKKVTGVSLIPVAIHYEQSMHERPEAWLSLGEPHAFGTLPDCQARLASQLSELRTPSDQAFDVLVAGTRDVNERMHMRRMP